MGDSLMERKMIRMVKFTCDEIFCGDCDNKTYSDWGDCICQIDGDFLEHKNTVEEDWRYIRTDSCLEEAIDVTTMKDGK